MSRPRRTALRAALGAAVLWWGLGGPGAPSAHASSCVELDVWVTWSGSPDETRVTPWAPDHCVLWTPLPPGFHLWGGHEDQTVPPGLPDGYRYDADVPGEPV